MPERPVWPVVENRWTSPPLQSRPWNKHQIPCWVLRWHEGGDAEAVRCDHFLFFFFSITMTIWLAVPVWPIWRASGCSAWGEIMMGCLGKNHNQSETIMQNYFCQSPSAGVKGWETPQMNQAMRIACYNSCIRQLILPANLWSSGWMGVNDARIVALLWWEPFCNARFLQKNTCPHCYLWSKSISQDKW